VSLLKVIRYNYKMADSQRQSALISNFAAACSEYTYQTLAPYGVIKDLTLEGSVLVVAMVEIACRLLLIYLLKMTYYQQAVKN